MQRRRAAIVAPVRTGVGAFGKTLRPVSVEELIGTVVKETINRSGIDPAVIEDVVVAQSYANSEVHVSGVGLLCRQVCRSMCRACNWIAGVAAACRPSSTE